MMKTQIGLGVLSIPAVFDVLGMIPGIICLLAIAVITTWSDYMVGIFKLRHRSVYGIDDAGQLMFGRVGREVLGVAFVLCEYHVDCGQLGLFLLTFLRLDIRRRRRHARHLDWPECSLDARRMYCNLHCCGCTCRLRPLQHPDAEQNLLARLGWADMYTGRKLAIIQRFRFTRTDRLQVFTVTVAVGIQDRPAEAPPGGVFVSNYRITNSPSFTEAISSCSSLVFAYAGTPAFFSIVSEMRDPRHYTRSLIICQSGVTIVYVTIGVVVYYYCGSYVASPALGSAGVLIKKICYGFALPGLIVTTTLVIHLPAKYLFVRHLRGSHHLTENTFRHWATWLGCTGGIAIIAYVIASAIPVFGGLVSLVGALLGTLMSFQPMGCMWLYDNWARFRAERTVRLTLMTCWSVFVVVSGTFLMIGGTYGSVVGIIDTYKASGGSAAWSCADNSNSV